MGRTAPLTVTAPDVLFAYYSLSNKRYETVSAQTGMATGHLHFEALCAYASRFRRTYPIIPIVTDPPEFALKEKNWNKKGEVAARWMKGKYHS